MTTAPEQVQHHRLRPTGLSPRFWLALIVVGLTGQVAWTVENIYLNVFVYETITDNPTTIAVMVAVSAIAATTAALVMGAYSDRIARRRMFVSGGYVLWGMSTIAFGWISPERIAGWVPVASAITAAAAAVIILDAVMSFLGGTANDAAFQAWVTDSTDPPNRGRVDGVLAVMPLVAMLLVFGGLDGLTKDGQWQVFFVVVGVLMITVGILSLVLVRDVPAEQHGDTVLRAIGHGLRPSAVRENPGLYLTLSALAILGISTQVFLPYLIIYLEKYLRIEAYALVLAIVLVGAATAGVLGGRVIDRVGKVRFMLPAAGIYLAGLLLITPARGLVPVILAGLVMMSGFMLTTAAIVAKVRDYTPVDRAGAVQGLRMIFFVLIPMVIGPFIGAAVISGADEYYEDLGVLKQVPTPGIFLAAAVVVLAIVIPVAMLRRRTATDQPAPAA